MKDFFDANRLRRIVLPGIILAAGIHPLVTPALFTAAERTYSVTPSVLFLVEILLYGLIISSAARPIFYVYEGHRLRWFTWIAGKVNRIRLKSALDRQARLYNGRQYDELSQDEQRRADLLDEFITDFVLTDEEEPLQPTRLGSIIATTEQYATARYGVDGVAWWHQLLSFAPKETVEEYAEQATFGESLVLTSAAGVLVTAANVTALIGIGIGTLWPSIAVIPVGVGPKGCILLAAGGVICTLVFSWLAVTAFREARGTLRTAVDLAMPKFNKWTATLHRPSAQQQAAITLLADYLAYGENPNALPASDNTTQQPPAGHEITDRKE